LIAGDSAVFSYHGHCLSAWLTVDRTVFWSDLEADERFDLAMVRFKIFIRPSNSNPDLIY